MIDNSQTHFVEIENHWLIYTLMYKGSNVRAKLVECITAFFSTILDQEFFSYLTV